MMGVQWGEDEFLAPLVRDAASREGHHITTKASFFFRRNAIVPDERWKVAGL